MDKKTVDTRAIAEAVEIEEVEMTPEMEEELSNKKGEAIHDSL